MMTSDMTSSRKQLTIDSNNTKVIAETMAPVDVMNTMLVYEDFYPINGHGAVPLVSTLFNSIKTQKNVRLKELLTSIVDGNLDKVKMMIERDASLLLEKLDKNDYVTALSGQRSNSATAYRTALAVEDTQMAAWIKNKLFELTGNHDAANTQYREQFPDGWEAAEQKRWAHIFTQLEGLTVAIRDAKSDDLIPSGYRLNRISPEYKLTVKEGTTLALALDDFRSELNALLHEIVTTGRHFNPHLLLKAFVLYGENYFHEDFEKSEPLCFMLFVRQVIGNIQRLLPVNYIQAFCVAPYKAEEKLRNNPQNRSLEMGWLDDTGRYRSSDFYPFLSSRLGSDCAIVFLGFVLGQFDPICVTTFVDIFSKLVRTKSSVHVDICTPPAPAKLT